MKVSQGAGHRVGRFMLSRGRGVWGSSSTEHGPRGDQLVMSDSSNPRNGEAFGLLPNLEGFDPGSE